MSKVWFITGSSRGFGAELVRAVLAHGDRVVATARQPEQLHVLIAGSEDRARVFGLDVTDAEAAVAAVEFAVAEFGRIDVVVNNAGYANSAIIEEARFRRLPRSDRGQPLRRRERHARRAAGPARAAIRCVRSVFIDRRTCRRHARPWRLPDREIRRRGLLRSARQRGERVRRKGTVRDPGGADAVAPASRSGRRCNPRWPSGSGWRRSSRCRRSRSAGPACPSPRG